MLHFGVLSYKGSGHLNPLIALSRRLLDRGHRVTFFIVPQAETQMREHGMDFVLIGKPKQPRVEQERACSQNAYRGISLIRIGISRIVSEMECFLRTGPAALTHAKIDALIVDEIALAGPTMAEILRLPYFVVSTSVPHNFGWSAPRRLAPRRTWLDRVHNYVLHVSVLRMRGPVRWRLDRYRRQAGLGSIRGIAKAWPELAHIAQLPQCLDFLRAALPRHFYYTGPFVDAVSRPTVGFPWERLDARPIVYASLGTSISNDPGIFHLIAEACSKLNVQLVISLGGRRNTDMFADLPGNPLVVRAAPQLELLKRAEIVITHGGLNTALETLMEGKPMIVIPRLFDQPAVAARLEWLKVAEGLRLEGLSAEQLRRTLAKMLSDPSYSNAARELQTKIQSAQGLERAVDVIEELLEVHRGKFRCKRLTCNSCTNLAW